MIDGLLLVVLVWVLFFGLNSIIRQVMVRNYLSQHDVLATLTLHRRSKEKIEWLRVTLLAFWVIAGIAGLTQSKPFTSGVIFACLGLLVLWPMYVRSSTRSTELLYFDASGMTIFPARTGMLHEGPFRIRIDWKDTFGYTIHKGNVLFSLLPSGYVEQPYSQNRSEFKQILDGLGIRKLVAYDVIEHAEVNDRSLELAKLEQHVEAMLRDVVTGYTSEFALLGFHLEVDCLEYEPEEDDDDGEEEERNAGNYAIVRVKLRSEDEVVQEFEWLVWEMYDDLIELISMPDDRLYEMFDERLQAVLNQKMRDVGIEPRQTLLQ